MGDYIEIEELPSDPAEAFLLLEKRLRANFDDRVERARLKDEGWRSDYEDFLGEMLGVLEALELEEEFGAALPALADLKWTNNVAEAFNQRLKHFRAKMEVQVKRKVLKFSVRFDQSTKQKIRHHIDQLRDIFDHLEVEERRRETLLRKLSALDLEVGRNRTRFDALAALTIEASAVVGKAVENSRILEVLSAIARAFHGAKEEEDETRRLPPPPKPKQIEGPKGSDDQSPNDKIPV